jgi:carboxyl-terminal processing protease
LKNKTLYPIYLGLAVCVGVLLGIFFNFPHQTVAFNETSEREQKLRQILNYIDYEYVDKVNTDSLLDQTIGELLQHLDPHSTYIPEADVLASEESIRGSFVGIGIEFKIYHDSLTVVKVLDGGPSAQAGIIPGDRILKADTVKLYGPGLRAEKVLSTLKGERNTTTELIISRFGVEEALLLKVKRNDVDLNSVQSAFILNDSIGVIKLTKFSARSNEEIQASILDLKKKGARSLIIDLRDNPGGLLVAAEQISDQFLAKDSLIVFTKDRNDKKEEFFATKKGKFENGKLAILINRGSASASEIVAGALQDNQRATIIGRRSFGKGLVQEEITLGDGSKMRLTTQRYYTPSGRSIQRDYETYNSQFSFHGNNPNRANQGDSTVLLPEEKEMNTRRNEGGIIPDIEIGYDTAGTTRLLYQLAMSVNLDEKAFEYVDRHRKELRAWPNDSFVSHWQVDSATYNHFFSEKASQFIYQQDSVQQLVLANRLKAFIAYNLFGNNAYQEIYSFDDPYIVRALEALEGKKQNLEN